MCGESLDCFDNKDLVIYLTVAISGAIFLILALYNLVVLRFKGTLIREKVASKIVNRHNKIQENDRKVGVRLFW